MSTGASIHRPILQVVSENLNGKLIFPNIRPECSFFLFFSFCGLGALRSWVLWGGYGLSREVENSKRKVKDEKQQETKGGLEKERSKRVLRLWTSTRKYFPTRRCCFWLRYTHIYGQAVWSLLVPFQQLQRPKSQLRHIPAHTNGSSSSAGKWHWDSC
ncbi:hypothetical protein I7I53_10997 [Histoplasma capsulatum var. duboisii H88]|uniref:Uncharacterized protein n=1 Tax=Ajellomyces capsulatus (strain H88) TaxID=544711 RepID=A0A8A1LEB9_AJEC8|nr:hypothetical protein I7I53_10997 [Histoplasma capsulatum var. duboisii H88]